MYPFGSYRRADSLAMCRLLATPHDASLFNLNFSTSFFGSHQRPRMLAVASSPSSFCSFISPVLSSSWWLAAHFASSNQPEASAFSNSALVACASSIVWKLSTISDVTVNSSELLRAATCRNAFRISDVNNGCSSSKIFTHFGCGCRSL